LYDIVVSGTLLVTFTFVGGKLPIKRLFTFRV